MTTKELQEKISKINEIIIKKKNLIVKRNKSIQKRYAQLHKLGYASNTLEGIYDEINEELDENGRSKKWSEGYDIYYGLSKDYFSIRNAAKVVKNKKAKRAKYQEMLKK